MHGRFITVVALGASLASGGAQQATSTATVASTDNRSGAPAPIPKDKLHIDFQISTIGGVATFHPVSPAGPAISQAIRAYGNLVREQFATGNVTAINALLPLGVEPLARMIKTPGVSIAVDDVPNGFALRLEASDQKSRAAIHDFVRFARGRPALTPEERIMNHPGNNLGWDTQKARDLDK